VLKQDRAKTIARRAGTLVWLRLRARAALKAGFTLIELLLTVALLAIILSIAIPRAGWSTMGAVQSKTAAREFANYLKLTRSLAITNSATNNQGYRLTLSPSGGPWTSYEIIDRDTGGTVKGPTDIPAGVNCTGTNRHFDFTPLGRLQGGTGLTAQFTKSTDTSTVTVTPIGRITTQ